MSLSANESQLNQQQPMDGSIPFVSCQRPWLQPIRGANRQTQVDVVVVGGVESVALPLPQLDTVQRRCFIIARFGWKCFCRKSASALSGPAAPMVATTVGDGYSRRNSAGGASIDPTCGQLLDLAAWQAVKAEGLELFLNIHVTEVITTQWLMDKITLAPSPNSRPANDICISKAGFCRLYR